MMVRLDTYAVYESLLQRANERDRNSLSQVVRCVVRRSRLNHIGFRPTTTQQIRNSQKALHIQRDHGVQQKDVVLPSLQGPSLSVGDQQMHGWWSKHPTVRPRWVIPDPYGLKCIGRDWDEFWLTINLNRLNIHRLKANRTIRHIQIRYRYIYTSSINLGLSLFGAASTG